MAITSASNIQVYNDQVRNAYAERVAKAINGFYAKAGGCILLRDAAVPGDYLKQSFFKMPSGLVSRRITTGTGYDSDVTPITVEQGENAAVRLSRKIGPVEMTDDSLRKILASPEEFSVWLGEMAGDAVLEAQISDVLTALVGALNRSPYLKDISADTGDSSLNRTALAGGLALLGDRAQDVACWIMHSKPYFDLVNKDLNPSTSVDALVGNVGLFGGSPATLGRPVIVIDDASLVLDATTDKYYTLGLTGGAAEVTADTQLSDLLVERVGGKENIRTRIQGERDWFLRLKGFTWDTATGGANPAAAALATATNWDASSTSAKDRAGVCIKST